MSSTIKANDALTEIALRRPSHAAEDHSQPVSNLSESLPSSGCTLNRYEHCSVGRTGLQIAPIDMIDSLGGGVLISLSKETTTLSTHADVFSARLSDGAIQYFGSSAPKVDSASSSEAAGIYRSESEGVIVGTCAALATVPARELREYYRGYCWAVIVGVTVAIPFAIILWALE